jgi:streptogramin lyase
LQLVLMVLWAACIGTEALAQTILEFPLTPDSYPQAIAAGQDGALWFVE